MKFYEVLQKKWSNTLKKSLDTLAADEECSGLGG
jgi:hypothetical protein